MRKTKVILFGIASLFIMAISISCSKSPVNNSPITKNNTYSTSKSLPSGRFEFSLQSPENNLFISSDERIKLRWTQPYPSIYDFVRYSIYKDGQKIGQNNYIDDTSFYTYFTEIGNHDWQVYTIYNINQSSPANNGPRFIYTEIDRHILGPNPIYSRNNQEWYIADTWSGSNFSYAWKVYNATGQLIVSTNTERLSINQFPQNLANGHYEIDCEIVSSSGKSYWGLGQNNDQAFDLTIIL